MSNEENGKLLQDFINDNNDLDFVDIFDAVGDTIFSSDLADSSMLGVNIAFRPWFKDIMNGKTPITKPYVSLRSHTPCVSIVVPIFGENEKVVGGLVSSVEIV